ncbi:MAG: hypothetical protein RLZZ179_3471 [Verrucomicrobiota bacterium]|jgi:low affinity Fe/Cu permease
MAMRNRFQRSAAGTVSFFAFQDIITAVTGILVIITVLLSLSLPETTDEAAMDASAETTALREKLDSLLRRIADLRNASESTLANPQASPRALEMEVDLLETELAELNALASAQAKTKPAKADASELDRSMASDLALEEADRRRLAAKLQRLRDAATAAAASRQQADAEVRQLEASLLAEMDRRANLVLVRDNSRTSKEPLVAVISNDGATVHRFDEGIAAPLRDAAAFRSALTAFSTLDHYFVFYAKPSGVAQIDGYLEAARNSGFEIGYDAIPEDAVITLESGNSRKP